MVRASPERVFAHIAHGEHLPRYATPLWMSADPTEKRGGGQVFTLRGYFAGLPVESVQRVVPHPSSSVEFIQVRGTLRALNARFTLRGGEDGTEVLYRMNVDPGIPMITDDTAQQFLVQFLERMLDRIKLAAERKTPTRQRGARGAATETALPGADDEEAEGITELPPREPQTEPEIAAAGIPPSPGGEAAAPHPAALDPARPAPAAPVREHAAHTGGDRRRSEQSRAAGPTPPLSGRRRRRRRHRRRPGGGNTSSPPASTR